MASGINIFCLPNNGEIPMGSPYICVQCVWDMKKIAIFGQYIRHIVDVEHTDGAT